MRRDKGMGIRRWRETGVFLYELGGAGIRERGLARVRWEGGEDKQKGGIRW